MENAKKLGEKLKLIKIDNREKERNTNEFFKKNQKH